MKLPSPGIPTEATTKNIVIIPMRGARIHSPPMFVISRVCSRSCSAPAIMKRAAVEKPWAIIVTMAPWMPSVFTTRVPSTSRKAKAPSNTKPMWATEL